MEIDVDIARQYCSPMWERDVLMSKCQHGIRSKGLARILRKLHLEEADKSAYMDSVWAGLGSEYIRCVLRIRPVAERQEP